MWKIPFLVPLYNSVAYFCNSHFPRKKESNSREGESKPTFYAGKKVGYKVLADYYCIRRVLEFSKFVKSGHWLWHVCLSTCNNAAAKVQLFMKFDI
jgi:hypothetical protein